MSSISCAEGSFGMRRLLQRSVKSPAAKCEGLHLRPTGGRAISSTRGGTLRSGFRADLSTACRLPPGKLSVRDATPHSRCPPSPASNDDCELPQTRSPYKELPTAWRLKSKHAHLVGC